MNNKAQQRFDRFTRECSDTVRRVEARESKAHSDTARAAHLEKAAKILPVVLRTLEAGTIKGVAITQEERRRLLEMKADYVKLLARVTS